MIACCYSVKRPVISTTNISSTTDISLWLVVYGSRNDVIMSYQVTFVPTGRGRDWNNLVG